MSEVNCAEHGPQQETFVCRHLVESLYSRKPVGFFSSGESRGDAWCSRCEELRIREGGESGGWTDASSRKAGIQLLCGACYDEVRNISAF